VVTHDSRVSGKGLFTEIPRRSGEVIGVIAASWHGFPFLIPSVWRFVNHCEEGHANARLERIDEVCCVEQGARRMRCGVCDHNSSRREMPEDGERIHRVAGTAYALVVQREIQAGNEITVDWNLSPWFMPGPKDNFVKCANVNP